MQARLKRRLRFLPFMLAVSAGLALVAALVGALVGGSSAALGALAGVLIVTIAFTLSTLAVAWAETVNVNLVLPVGMGMYTTKLAALFLILAAMERAQFKGLSATAFGLGAAIIVWIVAQAWWIAKSKQPYVDYED